MISRLGHCGFDSQRSVTDAIVVDGVFAIPRTIRDCRQSCPKPALGIGHQFFHGVRDRCHAITRAQFSHARLTNRIGRELRVEVTDRLRGNPYIRRHEPFQRSAIPVARVSISRGRYDDAFGMHIDGVGRHAGIAAAQVEVVRHRAGERDDTFPKKNRREYENVLEVLATTVGVVVDVEIAGLEIAYRAALDAGPKDLGH